jgi:eukaryotic-like serine/threonine-protein kinase
MATLTLEQWNVLSPYLDEALALTSPERSIWLSSLRSTDPVMAAQLEKLLEAHSSLEEDGFLERLSVEFPGTATIAGQTLGVYRLVSQIGQGGMSTVWLAERNDGRFERQVAVKFLNIALIGTDAEERFKREGKILGHLVHPNIAELLDAGVSQAGQPYLVLDYIEGDHIDRYCDAHGLDTQTRIRLFLDVLEAVAQAHANLIVHRDLKPSNVLVRNDRQVKLLDFGISKLLEGDSPAEGLASFTHTNTQALTPLYAAPEQLKGGSVTTATDIYALGVLLYVLLTGHHPTGIGTYSAADLIRAIVDTEPLRPSEIVTSTRVNAELVVSNAAHRSTTPERLRRLLRGDLDTVLVKALKKEPGERYASVTAFAEDLRRYLRNDPIGARPDTLSYRTGKFIRRNRTVVALATLAAVVALSGGAGILLQTKTARKQRDLAVRQLARAERIADLNELLLTDAAPMGKPVTVNQLLELEERIVKREHYDDAANHVELLLSIGTQYSGEDENAKGLAILEEAYRLSRGLKEPYVRAKASCTLSAALVPVGQLKRAESLFQEGLQELPDEPQFASDRAFCLMLGSETAYHNGDSKKGVERAEAAERELSNAPNHSALQESNILIDLAGAHGAAGKYREANAEFERASVLITSLGYDETLKAVKLFNDWALELTYAGQQLEAEKAYRRAIEISRTNQTDTAVLPVLLYNYSGVLRELGRFPEAATYADLAREKALRGGDQILFDQIDLQRARIFRDEHDFAQANALFKDLEPRLKRKLPPGHVAFASLTSDEELLANAEGNLPKALSLANQAVAIDEKSIQAGGQGAVYLPLLLIRRSAVELELQRTDRAASDACRALKLLQGRTESGSLSSTMGRAYLAIGRVLQEQGKTEEARRAFHSAEENLRETLGAGHPDTRSAHLLASSEPQHG